MQLPPKLTDTVGGFKATESREESPRYVCYVIFILFIVNIFNYMDRMALAVLIPLIQKDLQLSDSHLGLLVGLAFSLFYAVCGLPIARWADRGVRRDIIVIALGIWSAMTALSGAAQNFWQLFVARIGVGAGEAGSLPASQSMICDYVPLKQRSGVYAIQHLGLFVGMMVGMAFAGWLGEAIGWRLAFVILGLPGIGLALIVRLTLREPIRGSFDTVISSSAPLSLRHTLAILWRCRTYRLLVVFFTLLGFVQYGLNQWWPSFYARVFGYSVSTVGVHLGVAIGVGSAIGLLLGGMFANKVAKRDISLPLIMGAVAASLALPTALASLFVSSAITSILLVSLTVLFWNVSIGPVMATLFSVVDCRMRATAGAIAMFFTSALGASLGPFCVGLLSDFLSPRLGGDALRYSLVLPICATPFVVGALYRASMALPHDLRSTNERDSATSVVNENIRETLAEAPIQADLPRT